MLLREMSTVLAMNQNHPGHVHFFGKTSGPCYTKPPSPLCEDIFNPIMTSKIVQHMRHDRGTSPTLSQLPIPPMPSSGKVGCDKTFNYLFVSTLLQYKLSNSPKQKRSLVRISTPRLTCWSQETLIQLRES